MSLAEDLATMLSHRESYTARIAEIDAELASVRAALGIVDTPPANAAPPSQPRRKPAVSLPEALADAVRFLANNAALTGAHPIGVMRAPTTATICVEEATMSHGAAEALAIDILTAVYEARGHTIRSRAA